MLSIEVPDYTDVYTGTTALLQLILSIKNGYCFRRERENSEKSRPIMKQRTTCILQHYNGGNTYSIQASLLQGTIGICHNLSVIITVVIVIIIIIIIIIFYYEDDGYFLFYGYLVELWPHFKH